MKWEDYSTDFDWDGSLRDIYVLETSVLDWQKLFDFLKSSDYTFAYQLYELEELPGSIEIFGERRENKGLLCVDAGDVTLNCHFFCREIIEFDLDPREVKGEEQANFVFDFMRQLGRALNKEVILTPENMLESPIFKFSLVTQKIEFFPAEFYFPELNSHQE